MLTGYYFIIEKDLIWLTQIHTSKTFHLPEMTISDPNAYQVCYLNQKPCYVVDKSLFSDAELSQCSPIPFRQAHDLLTPEIFKLAIKAKTILHWLEVHQYCGVCGQPTVILKEELARKCSNCAQLFYPKTSPSVITLIERGNEILLARAPRFVPGMYSCIAGFIEPGETAEETLEREVFEEVGLKVKNLRYYASQHWPFPNSFMIGFFAEYASGEIIIDNVEIIDAQWFNKNNLPVLPTYASIARALIQDWLNRQ